MDPDARILTLALATTTIAKILVDMIRLGGPLPAWASPVLALLTAICVANLLQVAAGVALTPATEATAILAGILAAGTAVGVTELARRTDTTEGANK